MLNLITQIDSSTDEAEKNELAELLNEKTNEYGALNSALRIESFANRILNIPGTLVGASGRQGDVIKLKQLSTDAKARLKMRQFDSAFPLIDEAFNIIDKYSPYL